MPRLQSNRNSAKTVCTHDSLNQSVEVLWFHSDMRPKMVQNDRLEASFGSPGKNQKSGARRILLAFESAYSLNQSACCENVLSKPRFSFEEYDGWWQQASMLGRQGDFVEIKKEFKHCHESEISRTLIDHQTRLQHQNGRFYLDKNNMFKITAFQHFSVLYRIPNRNWQKGGARPGPTPGVPPWETTVSGTDLCP